MIYYAVTCSDLIDIYVGEDGKLHKVQGGADSVLNFSSMKNLIGVRFCTTANPLTSNLDNMTFFPVVDINHIKVINMAETRYIYVRDQSGETTIATLNPSTSLTVDVSEYDYVRFYGSSGSIGFYIEFLD